MDNKSNYKYLLSDLTLLKGVGVKTTNLLKKKKIYNIFDLLWKLPKSFTDRSLSSKIKDLKIGENQTITIKISGGETEIRTQERVAPLPVFKTGAFNHSAISP